MQETVVRRSLGFVQFILWAIAFAFCMYEVWHYNELLRMMPRYGASICATHSGSFVIAQVKGTTQCLRTSDAADWARTNYLAEMAFGAVLFMTFVPAFLAAWLRRPERRAGRLK
jgi:hypothetical protein